MSIFSALFCKDIRDINVFDFYKTLDILNSCYFGDYCYRFSFIQPIFVTKEQNDFIKGSYHRYLLATNQIIFNYLRNILNGICRPARLGYYKELGFR